MRDYSYRVTFKEGAHIEVQAGSMADAVILAAAQRISQAKHIYITAVHKFDYKDWAQVSGPVAIALDTTKTDEEG